MKILITGGAGFIGSHLAEFHLANGDDVVVLDDLSTGQEANLAPFRASSRFRFERGSIVDWPGLEAEVVRADRIYHMAAVVGMFRVLGSPLAVTSVNVCGTERLLELVAKSNPTAQIVVASSSSVYGFSEAADLSEDVPLVFSPDLNGAGGYALSKFLNEFQAAAYRQVHNLSIAIPRFFNAVGPRQCGSYGFVLPRFIQQALSDQPLTVFGDGSQTRSFCDVRDTVAMVDRLAGNPLAWGEVVNVGSGEEISILDLARLVIERTGSRSEIQFVSFEEGYGGARFRHIMQRRPSLVKCRSLTGLQSSWSLVKTIDDLVARAGTELSIA